MKFQSPYTYPLTLSGVNYSLVPEHEEQVEAIEKIWSKTSKAPQQ